MKKFSIQKIKHVIFLSALPLVFYSGKIYSRSFSPIVINAPEILQEAKKIPHEGVVKEIYTDYVFLKVSDEYLKRLYPLLVAKLTTEEKKCLHANYAGFGAHVSLFYPKEHVKIHNIPKTQLNYFFEPSELVKINFKKKLKNAPYTLLDDTWYVLTINSPSLQKFLISVDPMYNSVHKNELHISIAVSKKFAENGQCYNESKE